MPKEKQLEKKGSVELFKNAEVVDGKKQIRDGRMILSEEKIENSDWVDVDMAMPDVVELSGRLEDEDGKEMKEIRAKLDDIRKELEKPMPDFSGEGLDLNKDKVALESLGIVVKYNELLEYCKGVQNDGPADAVKIKEITDTIKDERDHIEDAITRYRKVMSGSGAQALKRVRTYLDALRFQRAEQYDLDSRDAKFSMTGGLTSKVYVIETGGKKQFFKEEENTYGESLSAEFLKCAKAYNIPDDIIIDVIKTLDSDSKKPDFYQKLVVEMLEPLKNNEYLKELGLRTKLQSLAILRDTFNYSDIDGQEILADFIIDFASHYNGSIIAHDNAKIKKGSNLSRRNVASSRLAALLGMSNLVASSRTAYIKHDGKYIPGNSMDEVDYAKEKELNGCTYGDDVVTQLGEIQILDLIAGQVDRNYSNLAHKKEGKIITAIKAIDNDMCCGELLYEQMSSGSRAKQLSYYNVVFIPEKTREKILSLDTEKLDMQFMDVISPAEILHLKARIKEVQKELDRLMVKMEGIGNEREREILKDPVLGPLWMSYTLSLDTKKLARHTYMDKEFCQKPKVLLKRLKDELKKRNMESINSSYFAYLADINA